MRLQALSCRQALSEVADGLFGAKVASTAMPVTY